MMGEQDVLSLQQNETLKGKLQYTSLQLGEFCLSRPIPSMAKPQWHDDSNINILFLVSTQNSGYITLTARSHHGHETRAWRFSYPSIRQDVHHLNSYDETRASRCVAEEPHVPTALAIRPEDACLCFYRAACINSWHRQTILQFVILTRLKGFVRFAETVRRK
jgi:hypothetical protein